jgi:hypothetical protein
MEASLEATELAPGRLAMQKGYLKETASIVGIILIALGILSLAYEASPVRFMLQAFAVQHNTNLMRPILGGLALIAGIALLFACQREG